MRRGSPGRSCPGGTSAGARGAAGGTTTAEVHMRRRWQLLGVLAAVGGAASVTLVFTIGAGARSAAPRVPGLPGALGTATPSPQLLDLGRIQPRRFVGTDYQTGGTGLRNQAEGGIT